MIHNIQSPIYRHVCTGRHVSALFLEGTQNITTMGWGLKLAPLCYGLWRTNSTWQWGSSLSPKNKGNLSPIFIFYIVHEKIQVRKIQILPFLIYGVSDSKWESKIRSCVQRLFNSKQIPFTIQTNSQCFQDIHRTQQNIWNLILNNQ